MQRLPVHPVTRLHLVLDDRFPSLLLSNSVEVERERVEKGEVDPNTVIREEKVAKRVAEGRKGRKENERAKRRDERERSLVVKSIDDESTNHRLVMMTNLVDTRRRGNANPKRVGSIRSTENPVENTGDEESLRVPVKREDL